MADYRQFTKDAYHIGFLIALVLIIVGVLTWTGVVRCSQIPGWCEVYYAIKGQPKILIVYGTDGLGDPDLLAEKLRDPRVVGAANISKEDIERVSLGNLKDFDMVIVERAKQIDTDKLESFMAYVDGGGRLVWTGDAGTSLGNNDVELHENEVDVNAAPVLLGPWARRTEDKAVRFDKYISVQYNGMFCDIKKCNSGIIGNLQPESGVDHKLIFGLAKGLTVKIGNTPDSFNGNFALVKDFGIGSTRVLSLETLGAVVDDKGKNFGQVFPLIVTSGVGERIAYYAIPPEQYLKEPMKYNTLIENLYYGMLR